MRDCVTQLPWGFQSDDRTLALEESQCVCGAEQLRQQTSADSCSLAWPGMEIPIPTVKSWEQWSSQPEQEDPGCSIPGRLVGLAGWEWEQPPAEFIHNEGRIHCGSGPVNLTVGTHARQVGAPGTQIWLFKIHFL